MRQIPLGDGDAKGPFILVERNGEPWGVFSLRKVDRSECWFRAEAVYWNGMLVVGFAERVYVVDPGGTNVTRIDLDDYFAEFAYGPDWLLVATASCVLRVDESGTVLWRSQCLGIDGIVIGRVEDGRVWGDGEWNPPGGWRPFCLNLADGTTTEAIGLP